MKELMGIAFTLVEKNSVTISSYIDNCLGVLAVVKGDAREGFLETFFNQISNRNDAKSYVAINAALELGRPASRDKELLLKACLWAVGEYYGWLNRTAAGRKRPCQRARARPRRRAKVGQTHRGASLP